MTLHFGCHNHDRSLAITQTKSTQNGNYHLFYLSFYSCLKVCCAHRHKETVFSWDWVDMYTLAYVYPSLLIPNRIILYMHIHTLLQYCNTLLMRIIHVYMYM